MRRAGTWGLAWALAATLGCSQRDDAPLPRSVVLVVVDTLRADALEAYGADAGSSPALAALAARGTVLEDVFAVAPWTGPAVAALVTGRYPDEVGVRTIGEALPAQVPTLAQHFQDAGYATASVVANAMAGPAYGHGKGYDVVHFERYKESPGSPPSFRAGALVDAALPWLEERLKDRSKPFFLYLQPCDPHEPYLPVEPWRSRFTAGHPALDEDWILSQRYVDERLERTKLGALESCYHAEVAACDDALGKLLARLPEDVLVAVVSDHGEEFGEHGGLLHGHTLFQELLHVPGLLAGPGVPSGRCRGPISQVDLAPTLLELAGVAFDPLSFTGRSLVERLHGADEGAQGTPARELYSMLEKGNRKTLAVRRGRWKLIHGTALDRSRLYDLESDPRETTDRSKDEPLLAAELLALLEARQRALVPIERGADEGLSPEREAELRALGYAR